MVLRVHKRARIPKHLCGAVKPWVAAAVFFLNGSINLQKYDTAASQSPEGPNYSSLFVNLELVVKSEGDICSSSSAELEMLNLGEQLDLVKALEDIWPLLQKDSSVLVLKSQSFEM